MDRSDFEKHLEQENLPCFVFSVWQSPCLLGYTSLFPAAAGFSGLLSLNRNSGLVLAGYLDGF